MILPSLRPLKPGNKNEMVGCNSRTRNKYLRRCKRSFIDRIPDELLLEIMLCLTAQDIYFGARLVCWKWYRMMRSRNFILKHLERTSSGLLCRDESGAFVSISAREDGGLDTYKLNYKLIDSEFKVRKLAWSSWNGLVLEYDYSHRIYHVTNISTDQVFRLPQCHFVSFHMLSGIGYDAASMTYKVVVSYRDTGQYRCSILTLGVDKSWRIVNIDHLSDFGKHSLLSSPINTEGFVHWFKEGLFLTLSLNLETEIIAETSPPLVLEQNTRLRFLPAKRHVSYFVQRGKLVWEVFEMNPEIGDWKRLLNISMEGQEGKIEMLFGFNPKHDGVDIEPCGWLKYQEVLALKMRIEFTRVVIVSYNLITCEIGTTMLPIYRFFPRVIPYKNSLEWLGGT